MKKILNSPFWVTVILIGCYVLAGSIEYPSVAG